ncbi:MAG: hypothetical protein WC969_00350 [Elusimicrobiota bacterium]|jgi:hypothetical protein
MKIVSWGLTAALATVLAASVQAFEVPTFDAAPVADQPAVEAQTTGNAQTLTMSFETKAKAEEVLAKVAEYLGPRLVEKNIVEKGNSAEMVVKHTGEPLSIWLAAYQREDMGKGLYYYGPKLTDEQAAQQQQLGQQALQEMVDWLTTGSEGFAGFFARPKVAVVYSYCMYGRVNGKFHDDKANKYVKGEIASPFPYVILDGFLQDNVRSHLLSNRFRLVITSKEAGQ